MDRGCLSFYGGILTSFSYLSLSYHPSIRFREPFVLAKADEQSHLLIKRHIAEEFGWVGFLVVYFLIKSIPTHKKKLLAVGKKVAQMPLFNLFFRGLGLASG